MAAVVQPSAPIPHKRKSKPQSQKKHKKPKPTYSKPAKKTSLRKQKLFRKRRHDYNSESDEQDDDDDDASDSDNDEKEQPQPEQTPAADADVTKGSDADDEDEEIGEEKHEPVTKLSEGSKGFKLAFEKIMGKTIPDEHLGPVLSAHKSLIAEKLAEEVMDHKAKTETKKLKIQAQEKGHVVPEKHLDVKEKQLISVATKGVVKLFNAVSKAQTAQKGSESTKTKDIRALTKRKKQTFLSELKKPTGEAGNTSSKDNEEPGWAPLRDSYMLTNSKLKNWDKMTDAGGDDHNKVPMGSSSDDE